MNVSSVENEVGQNKDDDEYVMPEKLKNKIEAIEGSRDHVDENVRNVSMEHSKLRLKVEAIYRAIETFCDIDSECISLLYYL